MPPINEAARSKELLREMTFLEHLDDLRGVLIHSTIAFLLCGIGCWFFSARVIDFLIGDLPVDSLNFFAPAEAFMVRLKVSFVVGGMIAFPYIIGRIWGFVSPALFAKERTKVYPLLISSSALFYAGVLFCYFVILPVVLTFLLGFGTDRMEPLISVSSYFAMVARLCFTFGLVFQLPIIVLVLSLLGIVTPGLLLRQWRYAILIIFVVAALLTPPDPTSQVLMALPVILLYIGSVLVASLVVRRKKKTNVESETFAEEDNEDDR